MPITLNTFRCSNGHTFEANAKLRTRCPECGVSTKRSFGNPVEPAKPAEPAVVATPDPAPAPAPTTSPEPAKKPTGPVLLRQGRPRMPVAKKPSAKTAPPKKHPPIGSKASVSAGLVSSKRIRSRGTVPTIKKRPVKTAVARGGVQGQEHHTPFWHKVADKYGL